MFCRQLCNKQKLNNFNLSLLRDTDTDTAYKILNNFAILGIYLKNSKKMVYPGFRKYLPMDHSLRKDKGMN